MSVDEDHPRAATPVGQAAEWLARLQGGAATGQDWLAFEAWLRAAPENPEAYERLERLWIEIDQHRDQLAAQLDATAPLPPPRRPSRRGWILGGGALAASLAAVLAAPNLLTSVRRRAAVDAYRTAAGETRELALADGTRIRMNAETALRVALAPDARRVALDHGEAAFDVAHDAGRPFIIAVGDRQVRVVGTAFDLRRRDGRILLAVQRGLVEVRPAGARGATVVQVPAGRQLTHREGSLVSHVGPADLGAAYAWTHGQLVYRDASIGEVAADVTRRFGVAVTPADAAVARTPFTGVLVTDNLPAVLRRLEAFAPVTAVRGRDGVVLRRRQSQ